jgi:ribosomal protein S12 methylthiotransferase accessory factor
MVGSRRHQAILAGVSEPQRKRLANKRVGILGLDAHGVELASLLSKCGLGKLLLADPFPARPEVNGAAPPPGEAIGEPRHTSLAHIIESTSPHIEVKTIGNGNLNESDIATLVSASDLVVECFDAGFRLPSYSLNRASHNAQRPALFSEIDGHRALVGPLVSAGKGPCYVCYRLRRLACADDYRRALQDEQQAVEQSKPSPLGLVGREFAIRVARRLLSETIAVLLAPAASQLHGQLIELDGSSSRSAVHTILRRGDCPICGAANAEALQPPLDQLATGREMHADVSQLSARLVSTLTGVIRECRDLPPPKTKHSSPHFCWARLSTDDNVAPEGAYGFGKGLTRKQARESAIGEALETYAGSARHALKVTYAKRQDIDPHGIDPRDLVLYSAEQHRTGWFASYSEDTVLGWVTARSLLSSSLVNVPAIAVFLDYAAQSAEELILPPSSNGLATGRSLSEAILSALYEVLERDAFLITWLNRLPARRIDHATHPNPQLRSLCRAMGRQGVEIQLFSLPTDHSCHIFAAVGRRHGSALPAITVGLGADVTAERSAEKAILEMAQNYAGLAASLRRPSARRRMDELAEDPRRVASMEDHGLLYASHDAVGAFDFLIDRDVEDFSWQPPRRRSNTHILRQFVREISALGSDVYYVNMTPVELSQLGLSSVRVIVPHFQPMHFGANAARLGGRRLFDLPTRLGLGKDSRHISKIPHPLG